MSQGKTAIVPVEGYQPTVSQRTRELLYFSEDTGDDITFGPTFTATIDLIGGTVNIEELPPTDPSTIFIKMPVRRPKHPELVPSPPYYPTYAGLTPEQKWIYLHWLQDISCTVDIGYVFIYYYGLERHLLIGKFDLAFDEILYLRQHHTNRSFLSYSGSALLHSCIFKKRPDRLQDIYPAMKTRGLGNTELLAAHTLGFDLTARNLMDISKKMRGINRRYITRESELFESVLSECLRSRYSDAYFPFANRYRIEDVPKVPGVLFANFSFPSEARSPQMPWFFEYRPFVDEVTELLSDTHEKVKMILREKRKAERRKHAGRE